MSTEMVKAFYKKAKVILLEPLGTKVRLGSVGYFNKGQWLELGSTQSMLGVQLTFRPGATESNSFDSKGGKGFKFEARAKGEPSSLVPDAVKAEARAEITFGSSGAFILNVKDQTVRSATKLQDLITAIRFAYRFRANLPQGERWERHYAVIVGVAAAASVTALSSSSRSANAIISGSAKAAAPTSPADLDASMKVSFTKESVDSLWRADVSGYAVQALVIKPSIFKRWDREDVVYLEPASGGIARVKRKSAKAGRKSSRAPSKFKRPGSYSVWAKSLKLQIATSNAEFVTPSRMRAPTSPAPGQWTPSRRGAKRR